MHFFGLFGLGKKISGTGNFQHPTVGETVGPYQLPGPVALPALLFVEARNLSNLPILVSLQAPNLMARGGDRDEPRPAEETRTTHSMKTRMHTKNAVTNVSMGVKLVELQMRKRCSPARRRWLTKVWPIPSTLPPALPWRHSPRSLLVHSPPCHSAHRCVRC